MMNTLSNETMKTLDEACKFYMAFIERDMYLNDEIAKTPEHIIKYLGAEGVAYLIRKVYYGTRDMLSVKQRKAFLAVALATKYSFTEVAEVPGVYKCAEMYKHLSRKSVKRDQLYVHFTHNERWYDMYEESWKLF